MLNFSQSYDQNHFKTTYFKIASNGSNLQFTLDENGETLPPPEPIAESDKLINITYIDGLGRPIQNILHRQSNTGKDIIFHSAYNNGYSGSGQKTKDYLPYVKSGDASLNYQTSAKDDVLNFYLSQDINVTGNPNFETTNFPYSEVKVDNTPEFKILKQAFPGDVWSLGSNHEVRIDYKHNLSNEVKFYEVNTNFNSSNKIYEPSLVFNQSSAFYKQGELFKTITKNENWKVSDGLNNTFEEFIDKFGNIILKRNYNDGLTFDTYYVYDEFNNLTYVLPPAVTNIALQLDNLCYQYKFDSKNRIIQKKLPGKTVEYIVYDNLNRVVASGPSLSPFNDNRIGWIVNKYDSFNRLIYSGWVNSDVNENNRANFQQQYSNLLICSEVKTSNSIMDGISVNYTNNINLITGNFKLLRVNYYDDYEFPDSPIIPATILNNLSVSTDIFYNNTRKPRGLATGIWVRVLNNSTIANYEKTYFLYDSKGRNVRVFKQNYLGGYTSVDTQLNFSGQKQYSLIKHKRANNNTELIQEKFYAYSDQQRLVSITQKLNNTPIELIAKYEYDELGNLIKKNIGGNDLSGQNAYQKVDLVYNIRGWLKSINEIDNLNLNNDPEDLFAFKISYDAIEPVEGCEGKSLYNGNISETYWKSSSDNIKRKYTYNYDSLDRLKLAQYVKPESSIPYQQCYDERIEYDKNGNISFLERYGVLDDPNNLVRIDKLGYQYDQNGSNQLLNVIDAESNPNGFKDGTNTTSNDYEYDIFGNLKKDLNKQIGAIGYNHINLPYNIRFDNNSNAEINYIYNSNGEKLKKIVTLPNSQGTIETEYLDGFQYVNSKLKYFPHEEGYVNCINFSDTDIRFQYVYNYTDHLGNIRVSYGLDPETHLITVLEENQYYPFGLKHENYNTEINQYGKEANSVVLRAPQSAPLDLNSFEKFNYKFNAKEYQSEFGLNVTAMDFRQYDSSIGRFNVIDPLAESSMSINPYHFANNNPVFFSDPSGLRAASASAAQILTAIWEASPDNASTTWINNGYANFDNENGSGVVNSSAEYHSTAEFGGTLLSNVTITAGSSANLNIIRNHVYANSPFYAYLNSGFMKADALKNSAEAIDYANGAFGALSSTVVSGNRWLGINGKYNNTSWGGNGSTASRAGALKAASNFNNAARATVYFSVIIGAAETVNGYQMDGNQFGYNAQSAAASSIGSLTGGWAGAEAGAMAFGAIGGLIGGPPGLVIGGVIGGILGGFGGGYAGGQMGQGVINYIHR